MHSCRPPSQCGNLQVKPFVLAGPLDMKAPPALHSEPQGYSSFVYTWLMRCCLIVFRQRAGVPEHGRHFRPHTTTTAVWSQEEVLLGDFGIVGLLCAHGLLRRQRVSFEAQYFWLQPWNLAGPWHSSPQCKQRPIASPAGMAPAPSEGLLIDFISRHFPGDDVMLLC